MDTQTRVYVANLGKYNEGELVGSWLTLPATEDEINKLFCKIGVGRMVDGEYKHGVEFDGILYEETAIHDSETSFTGLVIDEYTNLPELSEQIERIEDLDVYDAKKLEAVLDYFLYDIVDVIDRLDDFVLYDGICNDYDLGYYFAHDTGLYEIDSSNRLFNFIDYEAFGYALSTEMGGGYTAQGFIEEIS